MKIIISTRDNKYGAAKIVFSEIEQLVKNTNITKIYYVGPRINLSNKKLIQINIKIIGKYYITKEFFYAFKAKYLINQIIKKENIDLIYLHNSIYIQSWKVKTIFKCHGLHTQFLKIHKFNFINIIHHVFQYLFIILFEKRMMRVSNEIYFVSKETLSFANRFYSQYKDKFKYWPNYFKNKTTCSDKISKKNIDILYVGRLDPYKGILDLINVFNNISQDKNINFTIIGDGPLYNKILSLKNKNIKIIGYVTNDELQSYYQRAKLFVLPSYSENFPATVIEAIQNNCLVLASNVGDQKYILEKEQLITPGNVTLLKKKIEFLINCNSKQKRYFLINNIKKLNTMKNISIKRLKEILQNE